MWVNHLEVVFAAQPLAEADHAIENLCEGCAAFAAFQFTFGHTAPAARRLNSGPLSPLLQGRGYEFHVLLLRRFQRRAVCD